MCGRFWTRPAHGHPFPLQDFVASWQFLTRPTQAKGFGQSGRSPCDVDEPLVLNVAIVGNTSLAALRSAKEPCIAMLKDTRCALAEPSIARR